jgi:hypothetical protein
MEVEMEQTNYSRVYPAPSRQPALGENHQAKAAIHACKASQHTFQQACDHLKRAERDLAETAAFIVTSLTTVTAIQAVITIAKGDLELSTEVLQLAFLGYTVIFVSIFVLGGLRISNAIRRRTKAEREIDQAKRAIFEHCPPDQWLKLE